MAYKIINKSSPENLWGKFQQRSSQSNYARHCKDLQIPRLITEHAKKSYQYSTVKFWNTIPTDIRELPTISHIKKKWKVFLKSWLKIYLATDKHDTLEEQRPRI